MRHKHTARRPVWDLGNGTLASTCTQCGVRLTFRPTNDKGWVADLEPLTFDPVARQANTMGYVLADPVLIETAAGRLDDLNAAGDDGTIQLAHDLRGLLEQLGR